MNTISIAHYIPNGLLSSNACEALNLISVTAEDYIETDEGWELKLSVGLGDGESSGRVFLPGEGFPLYMEIRDAIWISLACLNGNISVRANPSNVRLYLPSLLVNATLHQGRITPASPDQPRAFIEFSLTGLFIEWTIENRLVFTDPLGIHSSPPFSTTFLIGSTGIGVNVTEGVCSAENGALSVSVKRAQIYLPDYFGFLPDIIITDATINDHGFSGTVTADWDLEFVGDSYRMNGQVVKLFGDFTGGLDSVSITFEENKIIGCQITGELIVPYFEGGRESAVRIEIFIADSGEINCGATGLGEQGIVLRKKELLSLKLSRLALGTAGFELSGSLQPLVMSSQGIQWPALEVKGLHIGSDGKISIKEAWLDLQELATLDLWGFKLELARLGIGTDETRSDGDRMWVDLSGSLRLMEQLPVGLGVEGFKISWPYDVSSFPADDPLEFALALSKAVEVSFDGVNLFCGVPDAVEFSGLIRFFKSAQTVGFAGDMALRVPASGFGAEAGLMIGFNQEQPNPYPFLYLYFGVDLPAGIPLGQSGLALKGAQGMFGINVVPDKTPEQNWYYDWYKRGPVVGAHPTNKWKAGRDGLALGVGVTITTTDGYIKGTRGLLVLSLPGPVLMIEGRALLLDGLSPGAEPPLRALAVFDGQAKTVQFNVEAEGVLVKDVLESYAMVEAFFDFNDVTRWHLYLGQDSPEDRRIKASILKYGDAFLFKADAYLMLDMVGAETLRSRMGVRVGFKPKIPEIGPVQVTLDATLEGVAEVTVRPEQFSGQINLAGIAGLKLCGVGVQVSAQADVVTEGPLPFVVEADLEVSADMPWPFEPVEETVHLEWSLPAPPKIAPMLAQVAFGSRFSSQGQSVRPDGNPSQGTMLYEDDAPDQIKARAEGSQTVALDSHIVLDFTHEMNSAHFAMHPDGLAKKSFDVGYFRYTPTVTEVAVYECEKDEAGTVPTENTGISSWNLIARSGDSGFPLPGVWTVGSDPHNPAAPSAHRLQLWTENPLLHTGNSLISGAFGHDTIFSGKPLAGRILDEFPSLMKPLQESPEQTCFTFEKWINKSKKSGEKIKRHGATLYSKSGGLTFRSQDCECESNLLQSIPFSMLLSARRKLRSSYPELSKDIDLATWKIWASKQSKDIRAKLEKNYPEFDALWSALFPKKRTCVCMNFSDDFIIHFPEPVSEVTVHWCQSAKISDKINPQKYIQIKRNPKTPEELINVFNGLGDLESIEHWRKIFFDLESLAQHSDNNISHVDFSGLVKESKKLCDQLNAERFCTFNVPINISSIDCEWKIRSKNGEPFQCLDLKAVNAIGICEICWTLRSDEERRNVSLDQAAWNLQHSPALIPPVFRPNCFYRLIVKTDVFQEILLPEPLEFMQEFFSALSRSESNCQVAFFQTQSPPVNLQPYVRSIVPAAVPMRHFTKEKIYIRFLRSQIAAMYGDLPNGAASLRVVARDSSGNIVTASNVIWTKAEDATFFDEEIIWLDYRNELGWPSPAVINDDILLADFSDTPLRPRTRYDLLVIADKIKAASGDTNFLFTSRFETSSFDSFFSLTDAGIKSSWETLSFDTGYPFLSNILDLQQSLAETTLALEEAEMDHRFDRLEGGRSRLEKRRLELRLAKANLDDEFRKIVGSVSADRMSLELPSAIDLVVLFSTKKQGAIGVWLSAPESLDLMIYSGDGRHIGRTSWILRTVGGVDVSHKFTAYFDSGSRHLLIMIDAGLMTTGSYELYIFHEPMPNHRKMAFSIK